MARESKNKEESQNAEQTTGITAETENQRKAAAEALENEKREQEQKTSEVDKAGHEALRQKVYETADKANGGGVQPLSQEGTPLTVFEQQASKFFETQNELEAEIDQIEVDPQTQRAYAGEDVNVLQAGDLNVGSATVTNYPGETIHPFPPTDYNAATITAGDLVADPTLAAMGLEEGDPMPPENNVHDLRETDGRNDTKDYMRRQRAVDFPIEEARRQKYPSGVEAPV